MQKNMLLILKKKESKTAKKSKIINLKSSNLFSLNVTELNQSIKSDE